MGLKQANALVEIVLKSFKDIEEITGVKTKTPHIIYETKKPKSDDSDADLQSANKGVAALQEYGGISLPDGISTIDEEGNLVVQTYLPNVSQNDLVRSALGMTADLILQGHPLDIYGSSLPLQLPGKKLSKKQLKKAYDSVVKECEMDIYQIIPGEKPVKHLRCLDLVKEIQKNLKTNDNDILMQEYTRYLSYKGLQAPLFIGNFLQSYLGKVLASQACYATLNNVQHSRLYNNIMSLLMRLFVHTADSIVREEISQAGKAIKYSYMLGGCAEILRGPKELEKILAIEPPKFAAYANNLYQEAKMLAKKQP